MESFLVVLDTRTGIKQRVHELIFLFVVNFQQNGSPLLCHTLNAFDSLGSQWFDDFSGQLGLGLLKLHPDPHEFTDHNGFVLVFVLQQVFEFLLKGGFLRFGGRLEDFLAGELDGFIVKVRLETVYLDCGSCFFKQTILESRVCCDFHIVQDDAVPKCAVLAYDCVFPNGALVNHTVSLDFWLLAKIDVIRNLCSVCYFDSFTVNLAVFVHSEHLVSRSLNLAHPVISVQRVGVEIPADEIHIGQVYVRGFVDPESNFFGLEFVAQDLFLVNFGSQHPYDKIMHSLVLLGLFKGFKNVKGADKDVGVHEIPSEFDV